MRRIILIKDKVTTTSWGFAFVEFVDVEVRLAASSLCDSVDSMRLVRVCGPRSHHVSPAPPQWLPHLG